MTTVIKTCPCCNQQYTQESFKALPSPKKDAYWQIDNTVFMLRDCSCDNTLAVRTFLIAI